MWKKLAMLTKMVTVIGELRPVLHMANLLASEMIHFVHQMAYYITFEVKITTTSRIGELNSLKFIFR